MCRSRRNGTPTATPEPGQGQTRENPIATSDRANVTTADTATPERRNRDRLGPLPSFVGIGVQRAGTTWLFEQLRRQPDLYLPPEKELGFFDSHYERGLDDYRRHFAACPADCLAGEISPLYYSSRNTLRRLRTHLPQARLIVVFRQPLGRAVSAAKLYAARQGWPADFAEAVRQQPTLVARSKYSRFIPILRDLFPDRGDQPQVLPLLYDDIAARPDDFLRRVLKHIGGATEPVTAPSQERINRVVYESAQRRLRAMGLGPVVETVKKTFLGDAIRRWHGARTEKTVPEPLRSRLLADFEEDIRAVEDYLQVDLPTWRAGCDRD